MRSGYININLGILRNAGINGYDWSSRNASNIWGSAGLGAYNLAFNESAVNPSNGPAERWVGRSLRF